MANVCERELCTAVCCRWSSVLVGHSKCILSEKYFSRYRDLSIPRYTVNDLMSMHMDEHSPNALMDI